MDLFWTKRTNYFYSQCSCTLPRLHQPSPHSIFTVRGQQEVKQAMGGGSKPHLLGGRVLSSEVSIAYMNQGWGYVFWHQCISRIATSLFTSWLLRASRQFWHNFICVLSERISYIFLQLTFLILLEIKYISQIFRQSGDLVIVWAWLPAWLYLKGLVKWPTPLSVYKLVRKVLAVKWFFFLSLQAQELSI